MTGGREPGGRRALAGDGQDWRATLYAPPGGGGALDLFISITLCTANEDFK